MLTIQFLNSRKGERRYFDDSDIEVFIDIPSLMHSEGVNENERY